MRHEPIPMTGGAGYVGSHLDRTAVDVFDDIPFLPGKPRHGFSQEIARSALIREKQLCAKAG